MKVIAAKDRKYKQTGLKPLIDPNLEGMRPKIAVCSILSLRSLRSFAAISEVEYESHPTLPSHQRP